MGYFQVSYESRAVNYDRRGFIRLATGLSLTGLDSVVSVHIFSCSVKSNPVKLETSHTVILPSMLNVLCFKQSNQLQSYKVYRALDFFYTIYLYKFQLPSLALGHDRRSLELQALQW